MSHPNPSLLAQLLDKVGEINLARAEGEPILDAYVDGVIDIKNRLKQAVEMVLAQRTAAKE
ncbi:MAG: hypothetical protein ABSB77_15850 [Xanthobacteraceae bacterium]